MNSQTIQSYIFKMLLKHIYFPFHHSLDFYVFLCNKWINILYNSVNNLLKILSGSFLVASSKLVKKKKIIIIIKNDF